MLLHIPAEVLGAQDTAAAALPPQALLDEERPEDAGLAHQRRQLAQEVDLDHVADDLGRLDPARKHDGRNGAAADTANGAPAADAGMVAGKNYAGGGEDGPGAPRTEDQIQVSRLEGRKSQLLFRAHGMNLLW